MAQPKFDINNDLYAHIKDIAEASKDKVHEFDLPDDEREKHEFVNNVRSLIQYMYQRHRLYPDREDKKVFLTALNEEHSKLIIWKRIE